MAKTSSLSHISETEKWDNFDESYASGSHTRTTAVHGRSYLRRCSEATCTALCRTQLRDQGHTLPCSVPVCRRVHTRQQNSEMLYLTRTWQPSAATKEATEICLGLAGCLQGFKMLLRVLNHWAWRSCKCWIFTEVCLAGAGETQAHIPTAQTIPGRWSAIPVSAAMTGQATSCNPSTSKSLKCADWIVIKLA